MFFNLGTWKIGQVLRISIFLRTPSEIQVQAPYRACSTLRRFNRSPQSPVSMMWSWTCCSSNKKHFNLTTVGYIPIDLSFIVSCGSKIKSFWWKWSSFCMATWLDVLQINNKITKLVSAWQEKKLIHWNFNIGEHSEPF